MKKLFLFLTLLLIFASSVFSQEAVVYQSKEGIAINGYDPVSYFKENKAVKGIEKFTSKWNGANWFFSSKENLKAFEKTPDKFAPQYGGYCAYGYSQGSGHAAPTKPTVFSIIEGKLYLNYNEKVQEMWNKDKPTFIEKANENYKDSKLKIKDQPKP